MTFRVALVALLSHWRRKPIQLMTLLVGLSMATALWSGVQAINTEARASYARASAALGGDLFSSIKNRDGTSPSIATFVALQRAGWRTSPVLEGQLRVGAGKLRVIGIEPVTAPPQLWNNATISESQSGSSEGQGVGTAIAAFLASPDQILASPDTAKLLTDLAHLPPVLISKSMVDGTLLTDIGVAERLLKKPGVVSRILLLPNQNPNRSALSEIDMNLQILEPDSGSDVSKLTDSFHLNLSAFGFLSFVVGMFIVHGSIGLAFEQRRGMFRSLRTMGLSRRDLTIAMLIELLGFALLAGLAGVALGYLVAASLLPSVAVTLRGLYGADIANGLEFRAQWWVIGLLIAVIGTAFAAAGSLLKLWRLPVLATAQPRAWAMLSALHIRLQGGFAILFFMVMTLLILFGSGLILSFVVLGLLLLGASLALPIVFNLVLTIGQGLSKTPLAEWFWADTRQQIPGLSLAMMALLMALAANIGVSTMVSSFRTTFTAWLDQRLAAEVYVTAQDEKQAERLRIWLEPRVDAVLPIWNVKLTIMGQQGKLYGIVDHETYRQKWPLLDKQPGVWDDVANGSAILINEQLAVRNRLQTGDNLALTPDRVLRVAGIYSDYGNPAPQVMVNLDLLKKWYPDVPKLRYGIRVSPAKAPALISEMREEFQLGEQNIVEQAGIKSFSIKVFEKTFAVTDALSLLTLAVAGFAIFTSLLTLATMRLPQLAPVWAMGLTRHKIAFLELLRAMLLAVLTAILALPVGLALAWALLALVNVEAFGWRLPMVLFPLDWLKLGFFSLVAAICAAAVPAWRISKLAPSELVKVFTNER